MSKENCLDFNETKKPPTKEASQKFLLYEW